MRFIISIMLLVFMSACTGPNIFPSITSEMANPISLAVDSTRNRLYVNNSDYRVSYSNGSIHVVNIATPRSPTRVDYVVVPSFAGQMYLDTTNQLLYTPNRESTNDTDTQDQLFRINVDESAANFLSRTDYVGNDDPFGISCCDDSGRMLVASISGFLDYYSSSFARSALNLTTTLDSGVTINGAGATRVVIAGSWAVITFSDGGVYVVNLDRLGVSGSQPIEYFISDITFPRGIATNAYDSDGDDVDDSWRVYIAYVDSAVDGNPPKLIALNITSLTMRGDDSATEVISKTKDGLYVTEVSLGNTDPEEVLAINNTVAYVTDFTADVVTIVNVVDTSSYSVTTRIGVGDEPYGMAALYTDPTDPTTVTHLFVTNSGDGTGGNSVSVIDISGGADNNTVVGTYP